jgi:hypothetical protein
MIDEPVDKPISVTGRNEPLRGIFLQCALIIGYIIYLLRDYQCKNPSDFIKNYLI